MFITVINQKAMNLKVGCMEGFVGGKGGENDVILISKK